MGKGETKYKGMIFEGRWEVINTQPSNNSHPDYVLRNIFSGEEMCICCSCMQRIVKGTSTISNIRGMRSARNKKAKFNGGYQYKAFKKYMYRKRKESEL